MTGLAVTATNLSTVERQGALVAQAREWLTEARDLVDVDGLRAQAATMETYARTVRASAQAITAATEIRLRAERRMGELLGEEPKHVGGRPKTGPPLRPVSEVPERLADKGLTKMESSAYQRLAAVPEPEFEQAIEVGKASESLSRTGVLKAVGAEAPPGPDASWLEADRFVTTAKRLVAQSEAALAAIRFGVYPGNLPLVADGVVKVVDAAAEAINDVRAALARKEQRRG